MRFLIAMLVLMMSAIAVAQTAAPVLLPTDAAVPAVSVGIEGWITIAAYIIAGLVLFATAAVRLLPNNSSIAVVGGLVGKLLKLLHMCPTFGLNPRTKALEMALEELKAETEKAKPNTNQPGS